MAQGYREAPLYVFVIDGSHFPPKRRVRSEDIDIKSEPCTHPYDSDRRVTSKSHDLLQYPQIANDGTYRQLADVFISSKWPDTPKLIADLQKSGQANAMNKTVPREGGCRRSE